MTTLPLTQPPTAVLTEAFNYFEWTPQERRRAHCEEWPEEALEGQLADFVKQAWSVKDKTDQGEKAFTITYKPTPFTAEEVGETSVFCEVDERFAYSDLF